MFQALADQDRESGASIVERAGMDIKDARGPSKPPFAVKPGRTSGTVHLFARAARTRASYEWAYSVDGTSWTCTEPTVRADKVVDGLTPATRCFFRVRVVTKAGVGSLRDDLSKLVE